MHQLHPYKVFKMFPGGSDVCTFCDNLIDKILQEVASFVHA